jgi:DNA repair protein RadC
MKNALQLSMFGVTEVMLTYKSKIRPSDRKKITCSRDAYDAFRENWNDDTIEYFEEFKVLLMNRANSVLGILPVSKGGVSGTVTDVRIILQAAITSNSSGLIICHNHPSGNLNPSDSDNKITQKIREASNIMDIQLLDHLIISNEGYYSFADSGMI